VVAVQVPVQLDDLTQPEPDFAVLKPRSNDYRLATPRTDEVVLIVEVADSSLAYDCTVKRSLYAWHGMPEFSIVNLSAGEVEICRAPSGDDYAAVSRVGRRGAWNPSCCPAQRSRLRRC
jgi:hypothetical protein